MQEPLGDLAERLAERLTTDSSAPVQEAAAITEEAALQDANNIFTKVRFPGVPRIAPPLSRFGCLPMGCLRKRSALP